jgi:hypothetical protein
VGGQFFFIITGLVSMTLLINGSTSGTVIIIIVLTLVAAPYPTALSLTGRLLLWLKLVEDPDAPMSLQKTMVLLRIKRYMKALVQKELQEVQGELGMHYAAVLYQVYW